MLKVNCNIQKAYQTNHATGVVAHLRVCKYYVRGDISLSFSDCNVIWRIQC